MATSHLPEEILIEIFSRLPTKSVGKCRCLSKSWQTRLSTSQFINLHFNRKTHQQNLIFIAEPRCLHVIPLPIENDGVSKKLELTNSWTEVAGSCNGLVLVVNEDDEMFLVNPITSEEVKILDSPLALKKNESFRMHGLGYDSCSDDYKIVTLSYYDTDNEHEPDCIDTFVDVYSVKRGAWKRVVSSPYDHAVPELAPGAFVDGAIHWLASSREPGYRSVIVAFDLVDEVFREIPAPSSVDEDKFVFNRLFVVDGCLCMVDGRNNVKTDVWIMEEYGLGGSWMRSGIDGGVERNIVKPLCFTGDDEVVLVTQGEGLVMYNVREETWRDITIDGVLTSFLDEMTFVESLVSPC